MSDQTTNTLTDQERAAGWRLLFDGQDAAAHWRGFRKDELPAGWQVIDGTLHRAEKAGDIVTREQFENCELMIDWKIAGGGNSGIFFRVSEDHEQVWHTGPEFQILNDAEHPNITPDCTVGSNYALHPRSHDASRPVGEWNHTRMVVAGPHVEHWLNGEKIVEYELWTEDWQKRVAATKFAKFPRYGRNTRGHLALQDHGDPVWFRNIKVREL